MVLERVSTIRMRGNPDARIGDGTRAKYIPFALSNALHYDLSQFGDEWKKVADELAASLPDAERFVPQFSAKAVQVGFKDGVDVLERRAKGAVYKERQIPVSVVYKARKDCTEVRVAGILPTTVAEMTDTLHDTFSRFGRVVDTCLYVHPARRLLTQFAAVVIDTKVDAQDTSRPGTLQLGEHDAELTWLDGGPSCRYCRKAGHLRDRCPVLASREKRENAGSKRARVRPVAKAADVAPAAESDKRAVERAPAPSSYAAVAATAAAAPSPSPAASPPSLRRSTRTHARVVAKKAVERAPASPASPPPPDTAADDAHASKRRKRGRSQRSRSSSPAQAPSPTPAPSTPPVATDQPAEERPASPAHNGGAMEGHGFDAVPLVQPAPNTKPLLVPDWASDTPFDFHLRHIPFTADRPADAAAATVSPPAEPQPPAPSTSPSPPSPPARVSSPAPRPSSSSSPSPASQPSPPSDTAAGRNGGSSSTCGDGSVDDAMSGEDVPDPAEQAPAPPTTHQ